MAIRYPSQRLKPNPCSSSEASSRVTRENSPEVSNCARASNEGSFGNQVWLGFGSNAFHSQDQDSIPRSKGAAASCAHFGKQIRTPQPCFQTNDGRRHDTTSFKVKTSTARAMGLQPKGSSVSVDVSNQVVNKRCTEG